MSPLEMVLVAVAGFAAGVINAIAGGGSLVSFPALLAVGYPAVTANVTNSLSMWPGYASSVAGFRAELQGQRASIVGLGVTVAAGGATGALLLLGLPSEVFDTIVPWCVLFASGLLAVQPRLAAFLRGRGSGGSAAGRHSPVLHVTMFAAGVYGAYFGGGLGVILIGILGLYLTEHLHIVIGLKNVLSLVVSTVAVGAFAVFAPISWAACLVVAPAALAGGFTGARLAKLIPPSVLRWTIVAVGGVVGVAMAISG
jgi:uncharacterized membrane protein YfcA